MLFEIKHSHSNLDQLLVTRVRGRPLRGGRVSLVCRRHNPKANPTRSPYSLLLSNSLLLLHRRLQIRFRNSIPIFSPRNLPFSNRFFDTLRPTPKHAMSDDHFVPNKLFFASVSAQQASLRVLETSSLQKSKISRLIPFQSIVEFRDLKVQLPN